MALGWLVCLPFLFFGTTVGFPISTLDFSYDPAYDSGTYASLNIETMGGLPSSFTICTSLMIKGWTNGVSTSMYVFKTVDREGKDLISLILNVASTSYFKLEIQGVSLPAFEQYPWIFPLDWVHTCISLEQSSGKINLVVDGTPLENRTFEEIKTVDLSSILSMRIGEKFTGQWASLNIFSSVLPVEKMKNITSAGNGACGESGDLVSWNTKGWALSGNGGTVKELEFGETPCRRVSRMHIYHMEAQHSQAHCMEHCKKLGGRSPSVQTQKDWDKLMEEVTTIAGNIKTLPNI